MTTLFSLAGVAAEPSAVVDAPAQESVLVTGTYSPRPALTAAVSVLDGAQIRALNKRTLAGVLKTVPGLLVEEQGGPGGLTAVSIRGGEANFTLVLLDGVPVNDPTNTRGGSFDFANLNASLVERIEIVRGAQSAIYGSDALAGVINIITRRPPEGHRQVVHGEAGQDDFYSAGASAQGSLQALEYSVEVGRRDDGEPLPGSTRRSDSAALRLGWRINDAHSLSAVLRYLDGRRSSYPEQGGGPELATSDALDHADYRDGVYALDWVAALNDRWRSSLGLRRFEHRESVDSPGIPPFSEIPPNGADTDFTRDDLRWVNTLQLAPGYRLDVGADFRNEEGDSRGYVTFGGERSPADFALDRDTRGVFAQVSAAPQPALLVQGSLRYDDADTFDAETSWQLGAELAVGAGVTLAANWGEAFKLPSFFALGSPLVGNPDLDPEKARGGDLGIAWRPRSGLEFTARGFFNDFRDLVDFDEATFRNVNRQTIETAGAELEALWQMQPALSLRMDATFTDIDVKGEDTVLTGRPEWTAGALLQWNPVPRWQTTLDYRFSGEQWAISRHTGQQVLSELDEYHRVDWVVGWQVQRHWQLQLSVDNLLDERYATAVGFMAPERALRVGLRLEYW
ncbi:MAG: TonB-dependent receptor [Halioglobus sp.]|nr:TonB-dependent receptor [Halioglobus sp.]